MAAARILAQKQTIDAFIEAWSRLSVDDMLALYTPDFQFIGLPAAALGGQVQSKEQWASFVRPLFAESLQFKAVIESITNDSEAARAVIHGKTYDEMPTGPYRNEHIMVLHFSDDGKKIAKLEDMMDSLFVTDLQVKMKEYFEKKAKA